MDAASFSRSSLLIIATLGVMFGSAAVQVQAHTLHGSVPARARMAQDRGAVDDNLAIPMVRIYYAPTMEQKASLDQLLADQRNPESSRYHAWLTPEEFGSQFGISPDDERRIRTWLASQGFSGVQLSRSRSAFTFSTTAGAANRAFAAPIHAVALGEALHHSNISEIVVPDEVSSLVLRVSGLDDFHPRSQAHRVAPQNSDGSGLYGIAPGDVATMYDLNSLYANGINGSGITIAIVGQSDIEQSNITAFRSSFGLPAMTTQTPPTFNVVVYGTDPGFEDVDENEAELDIEVAGGTAPNANLIYVNSPGVDNALFYAIEQNLAPIVSYSFGSCELPGDPGNQSILDQWSFYTEEANAQGMTILVASGDQGAVECDSAEQQATQGLAVEMPADVPGVTSVGGTSFAEDPSGIFGPTNNASGGSLLQYAPESVWDESPNLVASGGGVSSYFAKPYWQGGPGVPADGARDVPDLALFSGGSITNPEGIGYATCTGNQGPPWDCSSGPYAFPTSGTQWAGTSASTPTFAGIVALLNQYLVSSQVIAQPGLGNINPQLYLLGENTSNVFHAITGNSDLPCQIGTTDCSAAGSPTGSPTGTLGYAAGPGSNYNLATGLGSVDGYNLVHEWSNYVSAARSVSLSTNQTYPTNGTPIVLTANVTGSSVNGAPTGTVTFYSWDCVAAGLNSSCLTVQGTSALSSIGQATLNIPNGLSLGTQSVYASYSGDVNYAPGMSSPVTAYDANVVWVTASITTATVGQSITLVGQVSSPGTVTFYCNGTSIGSAPLVFVSDMDYNASLTISTLPAGGDVVTAIYSGDTFSAPGLSNSLQVTVNLVGTTTTLTASPTSVTSQGPVTLTATVAPTTGTATPSGSVTFYNGASLLSTVALTNGSASLITSALPVGTDSITAAYAGTTAFSASTSGTVQVTVNNATPTIAWATPAAITYGTPLSATQLNAKSAVAGTFTYSPAAGTVLNAGTQTLTVTFTPTDTTDYTTATASVKLTVNKAVLTISWATPAAISYGTALSRTQLDATSTAAGTFVYSPAAGTVLPVGNNTLNVTFTPANPANYTASTATAHVTLTVNKATPAITWATPASITYGTALSATQLNASSAVAGNFAYSPAAGKVLAAGQQTLTATFTPTNSTDYTTATATVTLTVNKARPTITWATPAAITYGTTLSATQLNAKASVPGTFVYSPAAGTVPAVGTDALTVTFTPADTTDYATATDSVLLKVNPAPSFTLGASPASLTVAQGASGKSTITVTGQNGFASSVSLAASGLPSGVTAVFATNPTTGTSVLTLTASSTATVGSGTVTIKGTSGSLTASTTVAVTISCTPTTIIPYISINGGSTWTQESSATVSSPSAVVDLGPQPTSGGSWSWTGPNKYASTSRQINGIPLTVGADSYLATYTNASGCKSTETFTIAVK